MEFVQRMPMSITMVNGEAGEVGVQRGWIIKAVGGESFEALDFESAFRCFKQAITHLKVEFLVRDCPMGDASVDALMAKVGPVGPSEVPALLKRYGYSASSASAWEEGAARPEIKLGMIDGHREKGMPYVHTWYALHGSLTTAATASQVSSRVRWQVERRLAHLRAMLHDPVKCALGKDYDECFASAHFAHHAGPPGTTMRLEAWLRALASWINSGKASPSLVALILRFLEAPDVAETALAQGTANGSGQAREPAAAAPAAAEEPAPAQAPQADAAPRESELDEKTDEGASDAGDAGEADGSGAQAVDDSPAGGNQVHMSL